MSDSFRVGLFIIGGMKCGPSALHGILQQQPQKAMSRPKETCYFVDRNTLARTWPAKLNLNGLENYHALFAKPLSQESLPVADLARLVSSPMGQDTEAIRQLIDNPIPEWAPILDEAVA